MKMINPGDRSRAEDMKTMTFPNANIPAAGNAGEGAKRNGAEATAEAKPATVTVDQTTGARLAWAPLFNPVRPPLMKLKKDPVEKSTSSQKSTAPQAGTRPTSSNGDSPAAKVRYAVVGLGHIAQTAVLPGFAQAKNSELAALVSGDWKKLRKLKKQYEVARTFTYEEFDECLADPEIDAVYVALPNDLHLDCVLRAAAARKHILCEKPLATNARDALLMGRVAEEYGVKLMTAYRLHFEPATLATIELIRSGKLGEARYFSSTFSYQMTDKDNIRLSLERGGGPVYDIGIYCINAARSLMQDEPIEVFAMLARSADKRFDEVEESAAVTLRFPRGRLASFTISFGASSASRLEFAGTKGRVVLEPAYEYSEPLKQVVTIDEKPEEKTFPHTDQFGGEIEAFSECILQGTEPEASAEEGAADLMVVDAIFASAQQGRPIRIRPWRKRRALEPEQVKQKPKEPEPTTVNVDPPYDD
jgi:glucose-fructose oxidoreductase